jgi:4-diphosphocytidyl-2-C-methyl-D-erythritol kinase
MSTAVRSHAKINLGLYIGAPRADGFHSLVTVYQTLEIHDIVTVSVRRAAETWLSLTSNDERVPLDSRNTAWKMAVLALEDRDLRAEVDIHIEKRLPVQGGLGAGSGNAVAALVGLMKELEDQELVERGWDALGPGRARAEGYGSVREVGLAARVGSDVPLFLFGGAVLGRDHGQLVIPLGDFEPVWCVVALPAVGVSTPEAFREWDKHCAARGLTAEAGDDRLDRLSRAYASAFAKAKEDWHGAGSSGVLSEREDLAGPQESALVRTGIASWIQNEFERVVFPKYPFLGEIKRLLAASQSPEAALHASLSGSGSALFGLYLTRRAAEAAQDRLRAAGVDSQLTRTLPRHSYWSQMLQPSVG